MKELIRKILRESDFDWMQGNPILENVWDLEVGKTYEFIMNEDAEEREDLDWVYDYHGHKFRVDKIEYTIPKDIRYGSITFTSLNSGQTHKLGFYSNIFVHMKFREVGSINEYRI